MKLLENSHVQSDSKILLETNDVRIEQTKLSQDLSTTTITIAPRAEYNFTARSGLVQTYVGTGTISNGSETLDLNMFHKVAIDRGEKVAIQNHQEQIPLVVNILSAN